MPTKKIKEAVRVAKFANKEHKKASGTRVVSNRPRSIYQDSNMAPRLSGQTSIFGVVFFVSKSLLGIERQKKLEKFTILTRKPRSHARIWIYRTWPIRNGHRLCIFLFLTAGKFKTSIFRVSYNKLLTNLNVVPPSTKSKNGGTKN